MRESSADVVIVGGGIAGGALATVLARGGLDVLVLEKDVTYRDKVRGETMQPWGVTELHRMGLQQILLDAGGHYGKSIVTYDEVLGHDEAEEAALPLDVVIPDVPGSLNVGHPEACEALTAAATKEGARVLRGVRSIRIDDGAVAYTVDDVSYLARCKLLVGADGRSSMVRRQAGFEMEESAPRCFGGGVLVDGVHEWPATREAIGTEGDLHFLLFPRPGGIVRLYLMWDAAQKNRFAGPDPEGAFLEAYRMPCIRGSEELASANVISPYAAYPMTDSWMDSPVRDRVILIGDAAGWNDPVIGQGLSIAMRDVRAVADVLLAGSDWSIQAFEPYVIERTERMRRLRAAAAFITEIRCTFTPEGAARRRTWYQSRLTDPVALGPAIATIVGPEKVPDATFSDENISRILALA